jgi:phosphatidylinositol-3-phosphatase
MKRIGSIYKLFLLLVLHASSNQLHSQTLPTPDHIVILFWEDKDYTEIVGDTNLVYFNALVADTNTALFNQSYCTFTGYSQPNYLDFYSGFNQGVQNNLVPANQPFTTENLGWQLMDAGKSFVTYAEDLPFAGFNGPTAGGYERKHNPVTNWAGTGLHQVPDTLSQPFTAYPNWDFNQLPTVTFVVPNQTNNMHDGTYPVHYQLADLWLQTQLDSFIQWTIDHNSLFILTFDEGHNTNRITTLFHGPMVQGGVYNDTINHFSVLRTIEDMYSLGYAGNAAFAQPITNCWKITSEIGAVPQQFKTRVTPNPVSDYLSINTNFTKEADLIIYGIAGNILLHRRISNQETLDVKEFPSGIYFYEVRTHEARSVGRFVKE